MLTDRELLYLNNTINLREIIGDLRKEIIDLTQKNQELSSKLDKFTIVKRKKTNSTYHSITRQSKLEIQNKIKKHFKLVNKQIEHYEFSLREIKIGVKLNDGEDVLIEENFMEERPIISVEEALYHKDNLFFTDEDYINIRKFFNNKIPSFYSVKSKRTELNENFNFNRTNGGKCIFVDLKQSIKMHSLAFLRENNITDETIKIKICCDGTNICRSVYLVNFYYCIMNDERCSSPLFHYCMGIGEIKETYEDLKEPFEFIVNELKDFKTIFFQNRTFNLDYYFSADLKLCLLVAGLKAANSNYPCVYCLCHKEELHLKKKSKIRDSFENDCNCGENYGYNEAQPSLLGNFIPFNKFIICTLHLRLRVFDVLIKLLITEICKEDNFNGKDKIDYNKHKNIQKWIDFLKGTCKINIGKVQYYQDNAAVITRDFMGGEILKIFEHADLEKLFPDVRDSDLIQKLWMHFYYIDRMISNRAITAPTIDHYVNEFQSFFLRIYDKKHAQTPYIHMFINHLKDLFENDEKISKYSQQGLEKINDLTTREYFLATNKRNEATNSNSFLYQILNRRIRIEKYLNN